jgi:glutamine---fructose-6-phosphate transaminase (isomerizing)
VMFSGCGSPFYIGRAMVPVYQQLTGLPAATNPASELFHYKESCFLPNGKTLLVVSSRSGETSEAIRACEQFKKDKRGDIITVTCVEDKPLNKLADISIVIPDAMEVSLTQTKALSSMYLMVLGMVFKWAGREDLYSAMKGLPAAAQSILDRFKGLAEELGTDHHFSRFYFLGSGPRYGLACELGLKMKETSLAHSEPFHVLEFRHGPKAMVNKETLLFALVSSGKDKLEVAVAEESRRMGAQAIISGEDGVDVNFLSGLPEEVQHALHLPIIQLVAYHRSVSTGLNPDKPENLNAFVVL